MKKIIIAFLYVLIMTSCSAQKRVAKESFCPNLAVDYVDQLNVRKTQINPLILMPYNILHGPAYVFSTKIDTKLITEFVAINEEVNSSYFKYLKENNLIGKEVSLDVKEKFVSRTDELLAKRIFPYLNQVAPKFVDDCAVLANNLNDVCKNSSNDEQFSECLKTASYSMKSEIIKLNQRHNHSFGLMN